MIFYGRKGSILAAEQLTGVQCPNCQSSGSIHAAVAGTYAHVYWIPFFPLGKKLVTQCTNCKQVLEEKDMPEYLRAECQSLKQGAKPKIWYFSGLALVAVLFVFGSISSSRSKKEQKQFFEAPRPGDRYEIKTDDGDYTTMKISSIAGDTVFFLYNQYSVNKIRGLYKIEKPENYLGEPMGMSRETLRQMHEKGKIIDIHRK